MEFSVPLSCIFLDVFPQWLSTARRVLRNTVLNELVLNTSLGARKVGN